LLEKIELLPDSCGPGRHRGGLGLEMFFHMLEDSYVTSALERTRTAPWGLEGGGEGRPNGAVLRLPDGTRREIAKATRVFVPKGATMELFCGGGGGYGPPSERDPEAVHADVREGYTTEQHARQNYPHAFQDQAVSL
jgi:N-methylhydantoinase B